MQKIIEVIIYKPHLICEAFFLQQHMQVLKQCMLAKIKFIGRFSCVLFHSRLSKTLYEPFYIICHALCFCILWVTGPSLL